MVFSLIGKVIKNVKESIADGKERKEAELLAFRQFIEETKGKVIKTSKYPEAELYRHAWKRAIVLKSLFEDTDKAKNYEAFEKMASDNYFKVAPDNPYRRTRLELSKKAYDKLLASEKKLLFSKPVLKASKDEKKTIRRPKKPKTRNPQYGHSGRTVGNYKYKSDGTSVDNFVYDLMTFLRNTESITISVSGLTGKPRRYNSTGIHSDAPTSTSVPISWTKTYRIGILVPRSFYDIGAFVDELRKESRKDDQRDYVAAIINPLSTRADGIFRNFLAQYDSKSHVTAGIKSDGRIRIWVTITLPVSAREIVVHCGTYLTEYPKKFVDEMAELVRIRLEKDPELFAKIFEDYDVRYKVLRSIEQKLRKLHGAPLIGEGFVNQTALFKLIKKKYPRAKFEYSPPWLGNQRFDIYIPDKKLAIEYNGPQHYAPVDVFGGEEGFKKVLRLDEQKRQLSRANNVQVYEWHFERPICKRELDVLCTWIDANCYDT